MVRQVTNALRLAEKNTNHFDYRWHETTGLTEQADTVSFQIDNNPGVYLSINNDNTVQLQRYDGSEDLALVSTFIKTETAEGTLLQPVSDPNLYLSVRDNKLTFLPRTEAASITQTFLIETQPGIIPVQSTPLTLPTETVTEDTSTDTDTTVNDTSQPASENEVQDQSTTAWPFIILGSLTILVISFYFRNKRHKA